MEKTIGFIDFKGQLFSKCFFIILYSILPKKERKNSTSLPWFLNLNCFRFFQGKLKTPKKPIRYEPTFRRFYKGFDPTVVFCWGCCNKGLSASSYFDDRNSHIFSLSRNKSFQFFPSPFLSLDRTLWWFLILKDAFQRIFCTVVKIIR